VPEQPYSGNLFQEVTDIGKFRKLFQVPQERLTRSHSQLHPSHTKLPVAAPAYKRDEWHYKAPNVIYNPKKKD